MTRPPPTLEELADSFAHKAYDDVDPMSGALRSAVARRPDLLEPLRRAHTPHTGFWEVAVQYVVPEFKTSIAAEFEATKRPGEIFFFTKALPFAERVLELLTERRSEYERVLTTRRLQTNLPGRVNLLEPAARIVTRGFRDLTPVFIELGSSAGLVLSELRHRHPGIVVVGVDVDPQRLNDADALRWIRAHFEAASPTGVIRPTVLEALARNRQDPPLLVRGEGVDGIRVAMHELEHRELLAPGQPVVVFHAFTAMYMDADAQAELYSFPTQDHGRTIHRISIEVPTHVNDTSPIKTPEAKEQWDRLYTSGAFVMIHGPDDSHEVVAAGTSQGGDITYLGDTGSRSISLL